MGGVGSGRKPDPVKLLTAPGNSNPNIAVVGDQPLNLPNYSGIKKYIDTHDVIQQVSLTAGTNISITGSYPSFTISTTGLTSDHGGLIGLSDDDHTQYSLVNASRAFTNTLSIEKTDAGTNSVKEVLRLYGKTSGTASAGIGTQTQFFTEASNGTNVSSAIIRATLTDVGGESYTSQLQLINSDAGSDSNIVFDAVGSVVKLPTLTSNGFVKTGSSNGTLSVDTSTYLTSSSISDTAYGASWDGDTTTAPSKNAVYDKIESLGSGVSFGTDNQIPYTNSGATDFDYGELTYATPVLEITTTNPQIKLTDETGLYAHLDRNSTNNTLILNNQVSVTPSDVNQIPTMTSNTAPSGVSSASSVFSGTYPAWKAFDETDGTNWFSSSSAPQWLKYQFPSAKVITKYKIAHNNLSYRPTAWTFEGSNDNSNWTTLDTQTGQTLSINTLTQYTFSNTTSYLYYRIYVTAHAGGLVDISRLQMFASNPSTSNAQVFKSEDSATADVVGVQTFGDSEGTTNLDGETINFQIGGSTKWTVDNSGALQPPTIADSSAPNNSVYYSSTQSKLVYKDSGGTVNNLY